MRDAAAFRRGLFGDRMLRAVGAADAATALLAERHGFDALWSSSLMVSTMLGMPDADLVTMTEAVEAAGRAGYVSSLPVVLDGGTGYGDRNAVRRLVREAESRGISAIAIEDKRHPKRNSFRPGNRLEDPATFARKIETAADARSSDDFVVIARVESLVVTGSLADALERAELYTRAGCDALLVHSKASTFDEIDRFSSEWHGRGHAEPLIVVPTTYSATPQAQLEAAGIAMVIYANHALRAAIRSIDNAFASIAGTGTTMAIESSIASLQEVFDLVSTDSLDPPDDDESATG